MADLNVSIAYSKRKHGKRQSFILLWLDVLFAVGLRRGARGPLHRKPSIRRADSGG